MRLIVTRPEPDASRTAAALRARGHNVDLVPLLHIAPEPAAELGEGPFGGIVITSANAARAIEAHPARTDFLALPVFAVGRRSADAARAAGFRDVTSADGDAGDLVRLVAARATRALPLLWLAGEDRAADLEALLAAKGITVRTVVVYRAVAATAFPPAVREALAADAIDGVLHYSPRSAAVFGAIAIAAGIDLKSLQTRHFCLSAEIAEALAPEGLPGVAVASEPDEAALFALIP